MPFITGGGGGGGALSGVIVSGTAAAGQVPVASSSAAGAWAYPPGFQFDYAAITATVNITGTTDATATTIITGAGATYDGGAVLIEVYSPFVVTSAGAVSDQVHFAVWEGATSLGIMTQTRAMIASAGSQWVSAIVGKYIFTPAAGAHTYIIKASASSTTGTPNVGAGLAGAGTVVNAWMRITKI